MPYNASIHTIPLDDEIIHYASQKCPCSPLYDDSDGLNIYVHHAVDGREASERAGKPIKGKGWTNVGEWPSDQ